MAMHFLRPPSAMDQSNSVTLDSMRAHSGSPFQGSHGRPSPTPSCYSVYVPDNEQDDEEHMPSYKPPTRNQAHHQQQQQQQPMQVDNGNGHAEREEESSHYDAARLEEIQRATAEHNAAYGIADELSTTLWDLKSGTDGPHGKPPYPYLTLIRIALISSENKRMTLQELYDALEARYPYFKGDSKGWKNSIRHNLSLNKCFKKEARHVLDPGKGSYWYVDINEEHSTPRVRHRRKTNENGSGEVFKSTTTSSGPSTRASRKRKQPSPDDSSRLMSPDEMRDVKPRIEGLRLPLSSIVIPPTPGITEIGGSSMQRSISSNGAQLKYGAAASVSGTGRTRAISAPSPVSMAFAGGIQNLAGHPQPYHHHHAHQYGHAQGGFAYGGGNPLASYGGSSYPYHYSTAPVANTIHTGNSGNGQSYTFPAVVGYPQTHYPVDYHPYAIPTTSASYAPYAQEPSTQQQEQVQVSEATAKTAALADLSRTNSPQNNDISVPSPPATAKQTNENGPMPDSAATISTLGPETPRSLFSAMLRTQNEASAGAVIREQQEDGEGDDKKITGQETNGSKDERAKSEENGKATEDAGEQKASSAPPANLPGPATGYVFPATAPTSVPSSNLRHIPPMSGPQYYSPHGYAGGPLYQYSAHRPTPLPLNTSNFPPSGSGVFSIPPSSTLNGAGKDKVAIWAPSPTTAALVQSPTRLLPSGDYEKLFSSAPFGMMWNENGRKNSRSNSIFGVVTR